MKLKIASTALGLFALCSSASQAALAIEFREIDSDVVMTTTGSLDLLASDWASDATHFSEDLGSLGGTGIFATDVNADYEIYEGTDLLNVDFSTNSSIEADSRTGGPFVILGDRFLLFTDADNNNASTGAVTVTPDVTITWENQTFESLGLDHHATNTAIDLWRAGPGIPSNDQLVQFTIVSPVPEPSSALLLALGGLGLLTRRKRD